MQTVIAIMFNVCLAAPGCTPDRLQAALLALDPVKPNCTSLEGDPRGWVGLWRAGWCALGNPYALAGKSVTVEELVEGLPTFAPLIQSTYASAEARASAAAFAWAGGGLSFDRPCPCAEKPKRDRPDRPRRPEKEIPPIPLPAAGWLMLSAIGALAGLRRYRRIGPHTR